FGRVDLTVRVPKAGHGAEGLLLLRSEVRAAWAACPLEVLVARAPLARRSTLSFALREVHTHLLTRGLSALSVPPPVRITLPRAACRPHPAPRAAVPMITRPGSFEALLAMQAGTIGHVELLISSAKAPDGYRRRGATFVRV